MSKLQGMRIACVATDGFEYSELAGPRDALEREGARVSVVSPEPEEIRGMEHGAWRDDTLPVDEDVSEADPAAYDALLLPGGVVNPDRLRLSKDAIAFIKHFVDNDKPIAAICHGPWTLINAGGVVGKHLTSWPSLEADLKNAGALWEDSEVVADENLVTSRKPDDLPAFNREMITVFGRALRSAS